MKKEDVICGLALLGLSAVLYTQTLTVNDAAYVDDINPMTYPRLLVCIMAALSALIAVKGILAPSPGNGAVSIFSCRTTGVSAVLAGYAAVFTVLGFALSSFLAGGLIAFIMGSRKKLHVLVGVNALAVFLIWGLFIYILRIPLPMGSLF